MTLRGRDAKAVEKDSLPGADLSSKSSSAAAKPGAPSALEGLHSLYLTGEAAGHDPTRWCAPYSHALIECPAVPWQEVRALEARVENLEADPQCDGYVGDPGASAPRCESYRGHPGDHFIRAHSALREK